LTVHSRAILKIVKSMCNGIKKSNAPTQLPHKFSYIVAILIILNHPILHITEFAVNVTTTAYRVQIKFSYLLITRSSGFFFLNN
jgi:hypothetical protein